MKPSTSNNANSDSLSEHHMLMRDLMGKKGKNREGGNWEKKKKKGEGK